ncbi:MAG: hypothetical protein ACOC2A_01455 [Halanaeroarchaeum sp.]
MEVPDDLDVLSRRRDFLDYLCHPAQKPAMVEDLDHSRSTVDRAIRSLTDRGFVERTAEGYVTTLTGRLALERRDAFLEESDSLLDAQPILNALPQSLELPPSAVTDGRVESLEDWTRPFEILTEELPDADRYRAVLPRLDPEYVRSLLSLVDRDCLDVTLVSRPRAFDTLRNLDPELAETLGSSVQVLETRSPGVGIALSEGRRVAVVACRETGPVGVIRSDDGETVAQASEFLDDRIATATVTGMLERDSHPG